MAKQKNIFDPEVVLPKLISLKNWTVGIFSKLSQKKKLVIGIIVVAILLVFLNKSFIRKNTQNSANAAKSISVKVDKSYDFPAINNQGKAVINRIKFTIATAEKTNQVLVNDKTYTAKNNKLFLIINLEFKNDATIPLNILPGDLMRLTYNGDEENKYAPDLHNNLVPVAAISTKLDRVGFVISDNARNFKIYVGELEGKKEEIPVDFPS